MGFGQLYYTSARTGLAGYPGYQFNAATPGLGNDVMRDVEELTSYEAVRSLRSTATDEEILRSPITLCYVPGPPAVVANVVFVGRDYSHRFGNYFAHALVAGSPGRAEFGELLPIELWRSDCWRREPVDDTTLPALPTPPSGPFSRDRVEPLATSAAGRRHLPALLTAVERAVVNDERKVVVVHETADDTARWIAAMSFLLPPVLAWEMSFATYVRQPRYARPHVVGTMPDSDVDLGEAGFDNYYLFDLVGDRRSKITSHPLADLLVSVGPVGVPELWRRAAAFAAGGERTFDEWYPVVLAATMTWPE